MAIAQFETDRFSVNVEPRLVTVIIKPEDAVNGRAQIRKFSASTHEFPFTKISKSARSEFIDLLDQHVGKLSDESKLDLIAVYHLAED